MSPGVLWRNCSARAGVAIPQVNPPTVAKIIAPIAAKFFVLKHV